MNSMLCIIVVIIMKFSLKAHRELHDCMSNGFLFVGEEKGSLGKVKAIIQDWRGRDPRDIEWGSDKK